MPTCETNSVSLRRIWEMTKEIAALAEDATLLEVLDRIELASCESWSPNLNWRGFIEGPNSVFLNPEILADKVQSIGVLMHECGHVGDTPSFRYGIAIRDGEFDLARALRYSAEANADGSAIGWLRNAHQTSVARSIAPKTAPSPSAILNGFKRYDHRSLKFAPLEATFRCESIKHGLELAFEWAESLLEHSPLASKAARTGAELARFDPVYIGPFLVIQIDWPELNVGAVD